MTDLKPCPFCGGADLVYDPDVAAIVCRPCLADGPSMLRMDTDFDEAMENAAVEAWNRRAPEVSR